MPGKLHRPIHIELLPKTIAGRVRSKRGLDLRAAIVFGQHIAIRGYAG